jgi:hypothetical protein
MAIDDMPVYDVNNYLRNDSSLSSIAGKTMNFFPVTATDNEPAPFVVYYYNPSIASADTWWKRNDYVRYSIFDTDADRLFKISERIIEVLGRADNISASGGIDGTDVRFLYSYMVSSNLVAPLEKVGWYRMNLDFRICSV